jgi:3-oxoacyl-[acyl-carrier-protein] synthase III
MNNGNGNGDLRKGTATQHAVRHAQITGWGMYVPERVLTNQELERVLDTTDEWIVSRTGIRERHIVASEKESTATLATRAAREALVVANLAPTDLDLVIVATVTPEHLFPATASLVQNALGAAKAGAFDLSAGCSGFVYALNVGTGYIKAGLAEHVLIVGAETLSRVTDWTDRNTCVLFGDGAGAVVLSACSEPCGVLATVLGSDGSGGDLLILPAGGSKRPASHETITNGEHFVKMNGREVFRFATQVMARATEQVAEKAGWDLTKLNLVIPHQANTRIIEAAVKRLNMPHDKFFVNLDRYGNTSSASIPIALCEAIACGRVQEHDRLVFVGFGAGLSWAAAAVEWGPPEPKPYPQAHRALQSIRFAWAAVRSSWLRLARGVYNLLLGPVDSDNWRGRLRHRVDRWRSREEDQ